MARYDNKRALVNSEIKRLMNIEKQQRETAEQIKNMVSIINEGLNALKNLKIDTTTWDPILLHIFTQKLSSETNRLWQDSIQEPTEIPKITAFLTFLENRFRTLENLSESSQSTTSFRFNS